MSILKWPRRAFSLQPSEQQLWQLFNSLGDVVIALDDNLRILTVNQCWESITGITASDTVSQPLTRFIHPEDVPSFTQLLKRLTIGQGEMIWFRLLHDSSEIRWCEMRIQAMQQDSLYPLSATICDITPQVRSEKVREASHRSLQSLVRRLPAMLYRARNNTSWTMEYVSEGCESLTGYSVEHLLNQSQISFGSLIHPEDSEYVWDDVQAALQLNKPFDLKYRLKQKSGKTINVREKGHGLYTNSKMVLGVEGIILQTPE